MLTADNLLLRGRRVRVWQGGDPSGPPLLLIHGFLVSHEEFDDILPHLASNRLILLDLPGFGESEVPAPEDFAFDLESFADICASLLERLAPEGAAVLGHSMGGGVAMTLAARHPELVKRLVLIDPLSFPFALGLKARLPLIPGIGGVLVRYAYRWPIFLQYFRDDVFSPGFPLPIARIRRAYQLFNTVEAREAAYATIKAIAVPERLPSQIGTIQTKTLILWGERDVIFPLALAHRLQGALANATLMTFPTAHSPHEEAPSEVSRAISPFLQDT